MLGSNLTTEHLFPLFVNPGTIRGFYNSNRLVELKTLIAKNRGGVNAKRKMQKVIMSTSGEDGQSMDIDTDISWENCEGMKEVMEGVLNLVALEHAIRPHSHQGIVILRVLHEVAYGQNYVSTAHDQRQVVETFVNEVLTRNAAWAIQGLGPLVYKPCKDMWEEVWGYTMANATKRYDITDVYAETFRLKATDNLISFVRYL